MCLYLEGRSVKFQSCSMKGVGRAGADERRAVHLEEGRLCVKGIRMGCPRSSSWSASLTMHIPAISMSCMAVNQWLSPPSPAAAAPLTWASINRHMSPAVSGRKASRTYGHIM